MQIGTDRIDNRIS